MLFPKNGVIMTVGIDDNDFYLAEGPGPVTNGTNPESYTAYSTTEDFNVGTKRAEYDDTNKGWTIFEYVKINGGTEGKANGMAVKDRLGLHTSDAATGKSYVFTPDGGEMLLAGRIVIALGTISGAQFTSQDMFGWVWAGGVAPVDLIPGTDGIYLTDGNVAAGAGMDLVDNSGPAYFGISAAADVGIIAAFALATDSNIS
jgi:hypothetical protein